MQRRAVLTSIRRISQVAALGFVLWAGAQIAEQWTGLPTNIRLGDLLVAGGSLVVGNVLLGLGWGSIVRELVPVTLPRLWLMRVFLASNLGRYMPGKVALPAIRIAALGEKGVGAAVVGTSIGLELLSWGCTCGIVAFCLLSLQTPTQLLAALNAQTPWISWVAPVLLAVSGLVVATLLRWDQRKLPPTVRRVLGLAGQGPLLSPKVLAVHLAYWGTWWLHGVALMHTFGGQYLEVAPAFVLAPVIGFLALIAPAGAGVREALVVAAATPVVGLSNAVTVSLLSRALSLAADFGGWLVSWMLTARSSLPAAPR